MLGIPGPTVPLPPGLVLADRWEVGEPLLPGGHTCRALDRATGEEVVVKLLAAMPFEVDLARVEAALAPLRGLDAVFVPRLLALEQVRIVDRHALLLVQERLGGESLAARVAHQGPLPEAEARALGRRLFEILRHLAQLDPPLVHGDLCPANVLLREGAGGIAIVDWAAPKAAARDWATQDFGPNGWSLAVDREFAAPEVPLGSPNPRSDLYGAGACLAFSLTGRSPDALRDLVSRRVLEQALRRCEVDAGLATLLVRLLDPTVEARLATPQQALDGLRDPASLAREAGGPRPEAEKVLWHLDPDAALGHLWSALGVAAATLPAAPLLAAAVAVLVPLAFGMTGWAILARLGAGGALLGLGGLALRAGIDRFAALGRTRLQAVARGLRFSRGAGWVEIPWTQVAAVGLLGPVLTLDGAWAAGAGTPTRRRRLWLAPVYALDPERLRARLEEARARVAALGATRGAPRMGRARPLPLGAVVALGLALLGIAALGHRWGSRERDPDPGVQRRPPALPDPALEAAARPTPSGGADPDDPFAGHPTLAVLAAKRPTTTPEEARQEALDALAPHQRTLALAREAQRHHAQEAATRRAARVFEEALAVVRGHAGSTAASARPAPPDLSQAVHPLAPEPKVTSSTAPAAPPAPAGTCPVGFEPRTLAPLLPPACWDAHGTLVRVPVAGGGAPFLVDWTEVTVADYAACVADGACTLAGEGSGCFGRSAAGAGMPVNCVDRPQAEAWCAWAGRRLCTAEEHVRAARGPGGAAYPWGEEPADCERAIRDGRGTPGASSAPGCGRGGPWPVGSRPAGVSPVGALDLSGNLAEWVAGSTGGAAGGSYMDKAPEELRADGLRPIPADLPLPDVGFRCCLDAAPTP